MAAVTTTSVLSFLAPENLQECNLEYLSECLQVETPRLCPAWEIVDQQTDIVNMQQLTCPELLA